MKTEKVLILRHRRPRARVHTPDCKWIKPSELNRYTEVDAAEVADHPSCTYCAPDRADGLRS